MEAKKSLEHYETPGWLGAMDCSTDKIKSRERNLDKEAGNLVGDIYAT